MVLWGLSSTVISSQHNTIKTWRQSLQDGVWLPMLQGNNNKMVTHNPLALWKALVSVPLYKLGDPQSTQQGNTTTMSLAKQC